MRMSLIESPNQDDPHETQAHNHKRRAAFIKANTLTHHLHACTLEMARSSQLPSEQHCKPSVPLEEHLIVTFNSHNVDALRSRACAIHAVSEVHVIVKRVWSRNHHLIVVFLFEL